MLQKNIKFGPVPKLCTDGNRHSALIPQPRIRKLPPSLSKSSVIISPTKKQTNPDIVRPNCQIASINYANQENPSSSTLIKASYSVPNIAPLESLSPIERKKSHKQKSHRKSCSADISWSPQMMNYGNEIREKKSHRYHEEQDINTDKLFQEPSYCSDNVEHLSPLSNLVEI